MSRNFQYENNPVASRQPSTYRLDTLLQRHPCVEPVYCWQNQKLVETMADVFESLGVV